MCVSAVWVGGICEICCQPNGSPRRFYYENLPLLVRNIVIRNSCVRPDPFGLFWYCLSLICDSSFLWMFCVYVCTLIFCDFCERGRCIWPLAWGLNYDYLCLALSSNTCRYAGVNGAPRSHMHVMCVCMYCYRSNNINTERKVAHKQGGREREKEALLPHQIIRTW